MIGILDWELCTLGSPLADLGNLLLPYSLAPLDSNGLGDGDNPLASRADLGLLVGLKGMSTAQSGLPTREEVEGWWVQGMNDGARWHKKRESGAGNSDDWKLPIQNMG